MHISTNKVKYSFFTLLLVSSLHIVASQTPEKEVFTHKDLRHQLRKDLRGKPNTKQTATFLKKEKENLLELKEWINRKEQDIQIEIAHRVKQQALLKTILVEQNILQ